jgi:hypothetical protein
MEPPASGWPPHVGVGAPPKERPQEQNVASARQLSVAVPGSCSTTSASCTLPRSRGVNVERTPIEIAHGRSQRLSAVL